MANRLLRTIAVTIGAGLAAGFGRAVVSRRARRSAPHLNPILTRLENIETRVKRVEFSPAPLVVPEPEEIAALGTLLSSQSEDIASLRADIERIETSVSAKMAELELRLRGEFQEIHYRTVDAFADTIEQRVVGRIASLESNLIEQSHSIVALREKSLKTDESLQKLLVAVERLCARAETQSQITLLQNVPPPPLPEVAFPARAVAQPEPPPQPQAGLLRPESLYPPEPEPEPEPELVFAAAAAAAARSAVPVRRGLKPVGMAILGLAILGFRLIR
jgi:hypothetical protein